MKNKDTFTDRLEAQAKAKQAEVYRMAIRCGLMEAERRLVADYLFTFL